MFIHLSIFSLIFVPTITPSVLTGLVPIFLGFPFNDVTIPTTSFLDVVGFLNHIGAPESPVAAPTK